MGKAAIDLPDPLEAIAPGAPSSVDDLLAQMAGEEIDRLLSESDEPHEKSPRPARAAPGAPAPVVVPISPPDADDAPAPAGAAFAPTESPEALVVRDLP